MFKPFLIIATSGFTVYFALQKLGFKIVASSRISIETFSDERISDMILENKRDKPVSVWSVSAVFNKDLRLELKSFNPPVILKPYETISLHFGKYSFLQLDGDRVYLDYLSPDMEIYVDVGAAAVRCRSRIKKDTFGHLRKVGQVCAEFNGHTFAEDVRYILHYCMDGDFKTAFISKNGYIGNEWGRSPNHLGKENVTASDIKFMMSSYGFNQLFSNYVCYKVNFPSTKYEFSKNVVSA